MVTAMVLVAAALIERDGRFLLARRPAGVHLAGLWEFPGGKVERDESPAACLVRELEEELGVRAAGPRPFTFCHWHYPEREILLLLYRVEVEGEPKPLHADALGWFTVAEARALAMPAADLPLLDALERGRG